MAIRGSKFSSQARSPARRGRRRNLFSNTIIGNHEREYRSGLGEWYEYREPRAKEVHSRLLVEESYKLSGMNDKQKNDFRKQVELFVRMYNEAPIDSHTGKPIVRIDPATGKLVWP